MKKGVLENVWCFVEGFYPQYLDEYVRIFVEEGEYYDEFLGKVQKLCEVNWGGG